MDLSQSFSTSQQMSFNQTSSSSNQEVYEGTLFGSGVLKGYKRKDESMLTNGASNGEVNEYASMDEVSAHHQQFMKDNGIFGGITGDHNSLVDDDVQFDYKKHSVRDLVGHFSKVKPKTDIPVQYLPEQRIFNGEQGPSLNYLSSKSESSSSNQTMTRTTQSKQDIEASRIEYESRKQKQEQTMTQTSQSSTTQSSQKSVEMRAKSELSEEQKQMLSQRRQSLRDYLLMDPATTHANAGIIDPSAILRGENITQWNQSNISLHTSNSASPSSKLYINKLSGPKPYGQTLPRASSKSMSFHSSNASSVNSQAIIQQESSCPLPQVPEIVENVSPFSNPLIDPPSDVSFPHVSSSFLCPPDSEPKYQATVQATSKQFEHVSSPLVIDPIAPEPSVLSNQAPGQLITNTNTHNAQFVHNTVINSSLKTLGHLVEDLQPAVSLSLPDLSRSAASTPLPTNPFPPLDNHPVLFTTPTLGPCLLPTRPRTPLSNRPASVASANHLTTFRPSSVTLDKRSSHMSKEDIARMMAELNAPLPPMIPIPQDIRASPLLFSSRGSGTPSFTGSKI